VLFLFEELAFAHQPDGIRGDFEHIVVFIGEGKEHYRVRADSRRRVQRFVFPQGIDGENAPAFEGIVHHIVVDESGSVKEFDEGSTAIVFSLMLPWEGSR